MNKHSEIIDVRSNKSTEALGNKFALLNVSLEQQVEVLNQRYIGTLKFAVLNNKVTLIEVNPDVRILELPELKEFNIDILWENWDKAKSCKVGTIKMPKSLEALTPFTLHGLHNVNSVWVWDTTKVDYEAFRVDKGKGFMIVVQHESGAKPTVVRF